MTLVKFNPYRGFESAMRRMDKFTDELSKGYKNITSGFTPSVDITEDENNFYVHMELPGMERSDVKISLNEDRILTIKGEKKAEEKKEDKTMIRSERGFGEFERSFVLPEDVDIDAIAANFKDGVLEITVPVKEPEQPQEREVEIK